MHFLNAIQHSKTAGKIHSYQLLFLLLAFCFTSSSYAVPNEYFKYQLSLNGALYDSLEEAEAAMMTYNDQTPYLKLVNELVYTYYTGSYGIASYSYDVPDPEVDPESVDCYKNRLLSSPCYKSKEDAANAYIRGGSGGWPYVIISINELSESNWLFTYYFEGDPTYCKQSNPCSDTVSKTTIYSCSLPGYRLNNENPPFCINSINASITAKFPNPQENGSSCELPLTPNPINLATGNKFLKQTDYIGEGIFPLNLVRYYNSYLGTNPRSGNWAFSFDYGIRSGLSSLQMDLRRPNGQILVFSRTDSTIRVWKGETQGSGILELLPDNTFIYKSDNDNEEYYSYVGNFRNGDVWRISKIKHISGITHTYSYDSAGRLENITDSRGYQLTIAYSNNRNIARVTVPGNRVFTYNYNHFGNIESVSYPDGTTKTYLYDDANLPFALTGVIDERNIRYATFDYGADAKAISSVHGTNANLESVIYNSDGTATLTNGRYISSDYTFSRYNGVQRFSLITGPGCTSCGTSDTSYTYNNVTGFLQSKIKRGITTEYGNYDNKGNPGYIIEAAGMPEARRSDYTYDSRFYRKISTKSQESVYTGNSIVTSYDYDDFGNTTRILIQGYRPDGAPLSRETTMQYSGPLNQLSIIDGPRTDVNDVTTFEYYPDDSFEGHNRSRLRRITSAGMVLRDNIQYSITGKIISESRPNGLTLNYAYHPGNDRLQSITESNGNESHTTYWAYLPSGEVETVTLGYGTSSAIKLAFDYDDARRLTRVMDGLGNYVIYQLDSEGNRESEDTFDQNGVLRRALSRTFDQYNRLDLASQVNESFDYNFTPDGRLASSTDGRGSIADYQYDALKRLISRTQVLGGIDQYTADTLVRYGYDSLDNLTSVTDPINGQTNYIYDDLGNLLQQFSPDTGARIFTYDEAGNRKTQLDANGVMLVYSYDALNRLTSIDAPGIQDDVQYVYDTCNNGVGQLCQVIMGDGTGALTTSYSYDSFGNVEHHQGMHYYYNTAGQLDSMQYPSGAILNYFYDAAGQVRQVDLLVDGQLTTLATNITYVPFGPLTALDYGNGLRLDQPVDLAYRYQSHYVSGVLDLSNILYDGNGNMTDLTNNFATINLNHFTYDFLNRLDTAEGEFGARDYDYDENGNRLQILTDETTLSQYSYEPASNRLDFAANEDITLDANGNTIRQGSRKFSYNAYNRLLDVSDDTTSVIYNFYNGLGQRISKDDTQKYVQFIYDLNGHLIAEIASDGTSREYYYLNNQPLAVRIVGSASQDIEIILDDGANVRFDGDWMTSSSVAGYEGNYYHYHAANDLPPAHIVIDNGAPEFSVTGTWATSTSVAGFEGGNYQHHSANSPSPEAQTADNDSGSAAGTWPTSTSVAGFEGANYQHHAAGSGSNTFTWSAGVAAPGTYEVYARWTSHANRASNATYTINHVGGSNPVTVSQQTNGGAWNLLGSFELDGNSTVVLSDAADGYVIADAIQVVPQNAAPNTATWQISAAYGGEFKVYAKWTSHVNRASNATYTVHHAGGTTPVTVNQQTNGGKWNLLGTFTLDSNSKVTLDDDANGYVIADAIAYAPVTALPNQALWSLNLPATGEYQVFAKWASHTNRASNATYTIDHVGGSTPVTVNQQVDGGQWNLLGTFTLDGNSRVVLSDQADAYVIADAIKVVGTGSMHNSAELYYIHNDHLGTPRAVTDAAQTVVWRWDSDPFGTTAANEDPDNDGKAFTFNLRFPGQYYDSETGLHYNYFRYYDPRTGRYITSDPIGLQGGLNTYGYVGGDPVGWIDPYGLDTIFLSPGIHLPVLGTLMNALGYSDVAVTGIELGIAMSFPGPWSPDAQWDIGFSGAFDIGAGFGANRLSLELEYGKGSVCDINNSLQAFGIVGPVMGGIGLDKNTDLNNISFNDVNSITVGGAFSPSKNAKMLYGAAKAFAKSKSFSQFLDIWQKYAIGYDYQMIDAVSLRSLTDSCGCQ